LLPSTQTFVLSFALTWEEPDGTSPPSSQPLTASISNPSIKAGDVIYEVTSSGLVAVGKATQDGSAVVTFSDDPTFMIAHAALKTQASFRITSGPGQVGTPLLLTSSGGSGTGLVSYQVSNGTAKGCAVKRDTLTATSSGTCLVVGTKAADANYAATTSLSTSLQIVAKGQVTPVTIQFVAGRSSLTASAKSALTLFSKKLKAGELITCTGYALGDYPLAALRASTVANFLTSRGIYRVSLKGITNGHDNWATVVASS
jgi:ribosomal protein S11